MTKYFCDKCETEITQENKCIGADASQHRLGTEIEFRETGKPFSKSSKLKVELLHGFNGEANSGIFCKYCILDAFLQLDDRPRSEAH